LKSETRKSRTILRCSRMLQKRSKQLIMIWKNMRTPSLRNSEMGMKMIELRILELVLGPLL
jgi:hypothetical protein